jgi:hypothetical protein
MIDVPDRPDVHVRLGALKFLFRHCFLCSSIIEIVLKLNSFTSLRGAS